MRASGARAFWGVAFMVLAGVPFVACSVKEDGLGTNVAGAAGHVGTRDGATAGSGLVVTDGAVVDLVSTAGADARDTDTRLTPDAFVADVRPEVHAPPPDAPVDTGPSCVDGAACATGNPGACGPGTVRCHAGAAPTCEPSVTTQACYSGPAGTRGVGACHAGAQSCVGALGACVGESDPAAHESCFTTADDNCDGKVNEGCPTGVALGAVMTLDAAGGDGGMPHTASCPTGAFLTRVDSFFDNDDQTAAGVAITCATPTLVQQGRAFAITLAPSTPAPFVTATGSRASSGPKTNDCGRNGLSAIIDTVGAQSYDVSALGHHCGKAAVTFDAATNKIAPFTFVPEADQSAFGFTNGGMAFVRACPAGAVMVGFSLRFGNWLDAIAPVCAPLVVTYGAGTPDP